LYSTGWTVRGSNPGGGEIFRNRPDRSSASYTVVTVWGKAAEA